MCLQEKDVDSSLMKLINDFVDDPSKTRYVVFVTLTRVPLFYQAVVIPCQLCIDFFNQLQVVPMTFLASDYWTCAWALGTVLKIENVLFLLCEFLFLSFFFFHFGFRLQLPPVQGRQRKAVSPCFAFMFQQWWRQCGECKDMGQGEDSRHAAWGCEIDCLTSLITHHEHALGEARQSVWLSQTVWIILGGVCAYV